MCFIQICVLSSVYLRFCELSVFCSKLCVMSWYRGGGEESQSSRRLVSKKRDAALLCLSPKATPLLSHTPCQSWSEKQAFTCIWFYAMRLPLCGSARLNCSASLTHSVLFQSLAKYFIRADEWCHRQVYSDR